MEKTALQQLKDWVEDNTQRDGYMGSDGAANYVDANDLKEFVESLFPTEKKQIEEAHADGFDTCEQGVSAYGGELYIPKYKSDYYNETFNQPAQ